LDSGRRCQGRGGCLGGAELLPLSPVPSALLLLFSVFGSILSPLDAPSMNPDDRFFQFRPTSRLKMKASART